MSQGRALALLSKEGSMIETQVEIVRGEVSHAETLVPSDHSSIRQHCILRHDNDAVSNVVPRSILFLNSGFIEYPDAGADMRILIDDGVPQYRPSSNSDPRDVHLPVVVFIVIVFV